MLLPKLRQSSYLGRLVINYFGWRLDFGPRLQINSEFERVEKLGERGRKKEGERKKARRKWDLPWEDVFSLKWQKIENQMFISLLLPGLHQLNELFAPISFSPPSISKLLLFCSFPSVDPLWGLSLITFSPRPSSSSSSSSSAFLSHTSASVIWHFCRHAHFLRLCNLSSAPPFAHSTPFLYVQKSSPSFSFRLRSPYVVGLCWF